MVSSLLAVKAGILLDLPADREAVDLGHHHVEEDEVEHLAREELQGFGPARGRRHVEPLLFQDGPLEAQDVLVIVHDKDPLGHQDLPGVRFRTDGILARGPAPHGSSRGAGAPSLTRGPGDRPQTGEEGFHLPQVEPERLRPRLDARERLRRVDQTAGRAHARVLARKPPPVEEAANEVLVAVVPGPFERTEEASPARALGGPPGERTRPATGDLREGRQPPREEVEERSGRPRAPRGERASDQGHQRVCRRTLRHPSPAGAVARRRPPTRRTPTISRGRRNRQSPVTA